ncbi:hypothetical protein AB0M44_22540 [Streptosporangium subroseum]|uniref:hypothetical protein n=1 Tax=Streptosporangium subroseum TaxID=106412 RepID=UPI0034128E5F
MSKQLILSGAAVAVSAALMFPSAQASAQVGTSPAQASAAAPAKVAQKLFHAWLGNDRTAAALTATPSAVNTVFSYVYRAPDKFAGCVGNACRFVHTSVRVPGGLKGILMIVSGSKVTKVYESRHLTKPSTVAKHLFTAWRQNDRNRGLEVATETAVKTLFRAKYDPHGVTYFFQGCTAESTGYACAYSYEGGALLMHLSRISKYTGYDVRSISYIAD